MSRPFVVGVGGFTSNVGKTTLMCELIRAFPNWEAIKTTRGHYRSCGKDPQSCCVTHLLSDVPVIRSGREGTYEAGKDTGRYWDAGAANVHWLIATDDQIEDGIYEALSRVSSPGVFVEGNSFSQFVQTEYFVMVRRKDSETIKKSAKTILPNVSAIFVSDLDSCDAGLSLDIVHPPLFSSLDLRLLITDVRRAMRDTERAA